MVLCAESPGPKRSEQAAKPLSILYKRSKTLRITISLLKNNLIQVSLLQIICSYLYLINHNLYKQTYKILNSLKIIEGRHDLIESNMICRMEIYSVTTRLFECQPTINVSINDSIAV